MWKSVNLFVILYIAICSSVKIYRYQSEEWWQKANFYQIYIRSFMDWDGDGIGDLKGLIHKVHYLNTLGVDAFCLSPIYMSPMEDFGYDTSDFMDVDPTYGTLHDFNELLTAAKYFDLKVILDLVPNHSSDEHVWFQKSLHRIEPYTNYYVWHDGEIDESGDIIPPNNWEDLYGGGSAWTWREERQQYYLHQFHHKEPDLNYNDPNLVKEIKDVLRFWLRTGIDGFRISSVDSLFEEPFSDVLDYMTAPKKHLPETYDMVKQWRKLLDEYSAETGEKKVLIVEAHGTMDQEMQYYGTPKQPGAHLVLNNKLITDLNNKSLLFHLPQDFTEFKLSKHSYRVECLTLGNQDNHRVASRFGTGLVDAMNMLSLFLPGPSFIYYGEEIGMEDTEITWEQCQDPQGINLGPRYYNEKTRDPERTPFQWDDTMNA
ncbi:hypothetical protein L9F63_017901, partial [Diploptera punctata]